MAIIIMLIIILLTRNMCLAEPREARGRVDWCLITTDTIEVGGQLVVAETFQKKLSLLKEIVSIESYETRWRCLSDLRRYLRQDAPQLL